MFVTVVGVMPVPAAARATAAPPSCVDSAVGLAAAVRVAKACGRTVEDTSLRSATTQVFVRANGVLTARISSGPARVRQGNGWADVDLTLVGDPDGSAGSRVHPQNLWLSGPVGAGVHDLVTIGSGSSRLGYGWAGPLPAPVLSGTTARYRDVRPGVDLVIEANRTGFEQSLVVKDRAALTQVASITFPLRSGGRRLSADGRHLSWRDPVTGEIQVESPEPVMWDAKVGEGSGEHPVADVGVTIRKRTDAVFDTDLVLTPDPVFLADPARQFPVTIDPGIHYSSGSTFDTWVQNTYQNTDNQGSVELKLGHATDSQGSYVARSYLRFPMAYGSLSLAGAKIYSAKLSLWEYHAWSCTSAKWYAQLTGPVGSGTRWNVEPTWYSATQAESTETKGYSSSCNDNWVHIYPTAAIQQAANWGWGNATIGLKGANDNDVLTWKRFNSANAGSNVPVLEIDFDHYPAVPAAQAVDGSTQCGVGEGVREYLAATTPVVTARLDDVNSGQNLSGQMELTQGSTVVYAGKAAEQLVAPGQTARWSGLTLTPGLVYTYRLRTYDGFEWSGWTAPCELQVDTDAPDNPPVVEMGEPSGGITPVTFRPDPTDTGEVAGYIYGDDPERLSSMVSAGQDGSATVPISTTADITVHVKAVNHSRMANPDTTAAFDLFGDLPAGTHVREDFNGDGLADVIGMADAGNGRVQPYVLTNGGASAYPPVVLQGDTTYPAATTKQVTGDFDGDGRADLALFKNAGGGASMMSALRSTGYGVVDTAVWGPQAGWSYAASTLVAGNFDGDANQRDDIAVVYNDGGNNFRLRVFVATGTPGLVTFAAPATWWTNCSGCADVNRMTVLAGDFDGDGKADFAHAYNYDNCRTKLWVHPSTGSAFTGGVQKWDGGVDNWCADRAAYAVGRFTNDNRDDIAGVYRYDNCDTGVWLWTPDAAGAWPVAGQWFRSGAQSWCAQYAVPHAADATADGKADLSIVYRCCGPFQAKLWRLASTGTGYAAPALQWEGALGRNGVGSLAVDPAGRYQLVATHSGLCLQVPGGGTTDGIQLTQDACDPANLAASFTFVRDGAGQVTVKPAHTSGKCVDIYGPGAGDGVALHQWSCHAGVNQVWQLQYVYGGSDIAVQVVSTFDGKCFDIAGVSTAPGAKLTQYTCWGGANQRFFLRRVA